MSSEQAQSASFHADENASEPPLEDTTWPGLVYVYEDPAPPGAVVQWVDNHGIRLRCARWPATKTPVLGTVCIVQGRTEFIEKYYEVISDLQARGFAVITFDFRGQGGSDRLLKQSKRGHVNEYGDYVSDLDAVMSQVMLPECPPPFFALAHSMGATVLLHSLQSGGHVFDRVVMTAPLIGLAGSARRQNLITKTARILNGMGLGEQLIPTKYQKNYVVSRFESNVLTSDAARFEKATRLRQKGPFLKIGAPTIGWVNASCQAMAAFDALHYGHNNRTPILMITSGNDKVVSLEAIEKLCYKMRSAWYILIPGALHEITQEREALRSQFWSAFDAFVPGTEAEQSLTG